MKLILLVAFTCTAPLCIAASTPSCEEIEKNAERGNFTDALKSVGPECPRDPTYLAGLKALASIQRSVAENPQLVNTERMRGLRSLIQKLDPEKDQTLIQGSYVLLDKLNREIESIGGSQLGQLSTEQFSLRNRKLLMLPVTPVYLVAIEFLKVFTILAGILLILWRVWPRKGMQISFEDLTAEDNRKALSDRVLMQDVQQAFWIPRTELTSSSEDGLELAPVKDRDAFGFGNLVPQRPLIPWADVVQSGTPIKVGPVAFDLKQIVLFLLSPLRTRRRLSLVGFIHESESRRVIMAQQVDWKGRQLKGKSWKVEQDKDGDRRELIANLAAQILVDLKVTEITTDWRSYRAFCRGVELLSSSNTPSNSGTCECIDSARDAFQAAVSFDASNWMARFYLAVCLCRCGENDVAVNHFDALLSVLQQADARMGHRPLWHPKKRRVTDAVVEHLQQYPQCPFLVLYNRAMALSGTLRACKLDEALTAVDQFVEALTVESSFIHKSFQNCASKISSLDRRRFLMLAMSAKASILATQSEYTDGNTSVIAAGIAGAMEDIVSRFKADFREAPPSLLTAQALADATLLNANGRIDVEIFRRTRDSDKAKRAGQSFRQAQASLPDLPDSYLNLVRLYLLAKTVLADNWRLEAEKLLRKLDRISPGNSQGKYLSGVLNADTDVKNFGTALSLARELKSLPEAYLLQAEIFANAKFGGYNLSVAEELWRKGLDLIAEPNQDQINHLVSLFVLAQRHPELGHLAQAAAQRLSSRGRCPRDRDLGLTWVEQLKPVHVAA